MVTFGSVKKNKRIVACIDAISAAVCVLADGRTFRAPIQTLYSTRESHWQLVLKSELYEGWFRRNLRISRRTFFLFFGNIPESINNNSHYYFGHLEKVAVTLHYMMNEGSYANSGLLFGIRKTRTIVFGNETLHAIAALSANEISLPTS